MKITLVIGKSDADMDQLIEMMDKFDKIILQPHPKDVGVIRYWRDPVDHYVTIEIETKSFYPSGRDAMQALYPDLPMALDYVVE